MSGEVYYPIEGDTLPIFFDTFAGSSGASITMSGLAVTDIEIFSDASMTQRASDNGYALIDTDGIDIDSITGIHGFSIDLSDNSDAGFFTVGPWYTVVVSSVTVDGQTVNFIAARFRILSATRGMTGTALPDAAADATGGLPVSDAGGLDLDARLDAAISSRSSHTAANVVDEWETQSQADPTGFHVNVQEWLDSTVDSIINIGEGKNYPAVYVAGAEAATGQDSITNWINNYNGTLTSFDGLDTAQDTQHGTTQSAISALNDLDAAGVRTAVGLASANLDTQLGDIPTVAEFNARTLVSANYLTPAAVNAEVVDALNVDTYAEPGQGAPPATTSLVAKIGYLFKAWRNKKTQDANGINLFDDAGTTVDQKSAHTDNGTTLTTNEFVTGP